MNKHNNLPLFTMGLDGSVEVPKGVDFVALVDRPAIQRGFFAFRQQAPAKMAFAVTSDERRIISGPLMLADTPIYRKPPEVPEECYITFSAPVIEAIVKKYFMQGNHANVNLMHDSARQVDGVVMFESFISDESRGIKPMAGHEDAPNGSWFGSFMVNNDDVWQQIKSGEFTGFSVEGIFSVLVPTAPADLEDDFTEDQAAAFEELFELLRKFDA